MSSDSPHTVPFEAGLTGAFGDLGITGRVLVGVSGGADSVALLRGVVNLRGRCSVEPVAAHLNHRLRGANSDADADFVRQLCDSLDVPLFEAQVDIRQFAAEHGSGIEEAARNARYEFLTRTAVERECRWVLLAHTADDQVETVLHHILRSTGLDGLRGIPQTRLLTDRVTLARPMLGIRRADIEEYLRSIQQTWREDETNRDAAFTRNRIRHELLPILRDRFNPQIDAAMIHLARQAAESQAMIDALAAQLLQECRLNAEPDVLRLDAAKLEAAHEHLLRDVLRRAWRDQGWRLGGMTFEHWATLAKVAVGNQRAVDLPGGVHAERHGRLLTLTCKNAASRVESGQGPG